MICMKCQGLLSLKKNKKNYFRLLSATFVTGPLRIKSIFASNAKPYIQRKTKNKKKIHCLLGQKRKAGYIEYATNTQKRVCFFFS